MRRDDAGHKLVGEEHQQGRTKIKITVVDFSGNTAMSHELPPVPPNAGAMSASYDLNISSLHAGNYVLKVETNGEMVTRQFVKE